jgi:hypothetical protein
VLVKDHYYDSVESLLAAEGREFAIGFAPRLRQRTLKQCFKNALEVSKKYGLGYAEGLVFIGKLGPIEHAWNVNREGKCIDVTLSANPIRYVGIEFPLGFVLDVRKARQGSYGILDDFENGFPIFQGRFDLQTLWQFYKNKLRQKRSLVRRER